MSEPEKDLNATAEELEELLDAAERPEAEATDKPQEEAKEDGRHPRHEKKKKLEEKIASLEEEIASLSGKNAELEDRFLRKVAEFDNYRKRTDREKLESFSNGAGKTLQAMLPVLDSLELAAATECGDENYKKGVDLTVGLMNTTLEKLGVTRMEALGKPFDPQFHNAILTEPAGEGQESGTVSKVFQNGYMLEGKCIRPAMVAVIE